MLKQLEGVNEIQILVEGTPFDYSASPSKGVFANSLSFSDSVEAEDIL